MKADSSAVTHRWIKWTVALVAAPLVLAAVFITIFGWNWLRGPIERIALEKTGRVLQINGDFNVSLGWPRPHIYAGAVTFANPAWAKEKQMVSAEAVDITLDLPQLLRRKIVFPEVKLLAAVVFLEQGSEGRKSWLLDRKQQDEGAVVQLGRVTLQKGQLGYDDVEQKTSIRAQISTTEQPSESPGVNFAAQGRYKGQPVIVKGQGGPVLALRDESTPYPLTIDLTVGGTGVKAQGTITGLLKFVELDLRLALRGTSLAQLYPLIGIAMPATRSYVAEGQLIHSGQNWRYQKFSGRIGRSDIAGTFELDTGGKRPALKAELVSKLLDIADLGPLIGVRPNRSQTTTATKTTRVLPDLPFNTERWDSVDAEVTLQAKTIRRDEALPLEDLQTHLSLRDSVLTLDPLNFGIAGGQLNTVISLDGRQDPIQAKARVKAEKMSIAKLFPTVALNQISIGQVNGEFELTGKGNTVAQMLATSNGNAGLVVAGGEISKLMMERVGLHLWEMLELNLTGDKRIKLRCAVADFNLRQGIMHTDALVLDTAVTTIVGTGSLDLREEKINLTLNQKTKNTSPLALRSPIYIRGSFQNPEVKIDQARLAARALGALALGLVNPLLTLLPLVDPGPGADSDCGQLLRAARALSKSQKPSLGISSPS
jgi:uncharacterized protein involved in outer membrane biogenesis